MVLLVVMVLGALALLFGGSVLAFVNAFRLSALKDEVRKLTDLVELADYRRALVAAPEARTPRTGVSAGGFAAPGVGLPLDVAAAPASAAGVVAAGAPAAPARPVAPSAARAPEGPPVPASLRGERLESRIGKRWITWAGAAALFVGAAFFVSYAIHNGWLGPVARVVLGVVFGAGLLGAGLLAVARAMRPLGQGLAGAGLGILYASLFAAHGLYGLVSTPAAFALMALVTATGMLVAVLQDGKAIAVLAVLGGLATPVLLGAGGGGREALLGYVLVLDLGVLAVAFVRRWRALDVLAFVGTFALFVGWLATEWDGGGLPATSAWAVGFFALFLASGLAPHLLWRTRVLPERLFGAATNAATTFGVLAAVLWPAHPHALGLLALLLAGAFALAALAARRRVPDDRNATWGLAAAAVVLATTAVPIHLDFEAVTLAWAAEALVLLYLGYRYDSLPERLCSAVVLGLAFARFPLLHFPPHEAAFVPVLNAEAGTALVVAATGLAAVLVHRSFRRRSSPADRAIATATAVCSAALVLVAFHLEAWQWQSLVGAPEAAAWTSAAVWLGGGLALLASSARTGAAWSRPTGLAAALVGIALLGGHHAAALAAGAEGGVGPVVVALVATATLLAFSRALRPSPGAGGAGAGWPSNLLLGVAVAVLTAAAAAEVAERLVPAKEVDLARVLVVGLLVAASLSLLALSSRRASVGLLGTGAAAAAAACLGAFGAFAGERLGPTLVLNGRFLVGLAAVSACFAFGAVLGRRRRTEAGGGAASAACLVTGIVLLLLLLSAETYLFLAGEAGAPAARWLAQAGLSIVWAAYALGLLAVGFWRRVSALRLAGLVLLGLTAAKLVFVDVASVREIYRVVSFVVVGAFLISASFLYHRLERRVLRQG